MFVKRDDRQRKKKGLILDLVYIYLRVPSFGAAKTSFLLSEDLRKGNAMFKSCQLFLEFQHAF